MAGLSVAAKSASWPPMQKPTTPTFCVDDCPSR